MVIPLQQYSSQPIEAQRNTMRAREQARMPVGPLRGTRIYEIRSARVLLDALTWPASLLLTDVQRAAIKSQLRVADWSTVDGLPDEQEDEEILFHIERCREVVARRGSTGNR